MSVMNAILRRCGNQLTRNRNVALGDRCRFLTKTGLYVGPGTGKGNVLFVNTADGNDKRDGESWDRALLTMAKGISKAVAGDTIIFTGTLTEACTLAKDDITILGAMPVLKANWWKESAADDDLLTITGSRCTIANVYINVPTAGGRGIVLSGADYTRVLGCKFQGRTGSHHGISTDGTNDNCQIIGNEFSFLNTATHGCAIFGHTYTADIVDGGWLVEDNIFHNGLRHLYARARSWVIRRNIFQAVGIGADGLALTATTKINLSGAQSGYNNLYDNQFGGDFSNTGGYTASAASDDWAGNFSSDTAEAEVGDNGITIAQPS